MAQNEQTTEEHSTLEQQSPGRLDHPQKLCGSTECLQFSTETARRQFSVADGCLNSYVHVQSDWDEDTA